MPVDPITVVSKGSMMTPDRPVALITGGARRVGRAIVLELADAGYDVAIHYKSSHAEARDLAEQVTAMRRRAITIEGDLNKPDSWPDIILQTVEQLQRLDVLINNASVFLRGAEASNPTGGDTVDDFCLAQWESMLRTNLVAPMALCHHAKPYLEAHGRGKIINLCDIAGDRPWPSHLAYCASKAALAALTKGLALALAPSVQVNGVAPGIAEFPSVYPDELRRRLIDKVPLGRAGTCEEVARLVRFLVQSGDYMTGQIIAIDGGRSLV